MMRALRYTILDVHRGLLRRVHVADARDLVELVRGSSGCSRVDGADVRSGVVVAILGLADLLRRSRALRVAARLVRGVEGAAVRPAHLRGAHFYATRHATRASRTEGRQHEHWYDPISDLSACISSPPLVRDGPSSTRVCQ